MKKLSLLLALTLGLSTAAYATFPVRKTFVHQQPDGQRITVNSVSNGQYTLYFTSDNKAVLPSTDGHYYYATTSGNTLQPSTQLAQSPMTEAARAISAKAMTLSQAERIMSQEASKATKSLSPRSLNTSTQDGLGKYGQSAVGVVKSIGSPIIPVVMIDFADRAFQDTITETKVSRLFNEEGYRDEPAARGSVRDYFIAQSGGMFTPSFKVVAHVKVSNGYAYYGKDATSGSIDPNASTLVREALAEASKTVDFSEFRTEGTTEVPLVALMFAGPGQQSSFEDGNTDYLWAKFSQTKYDVNGGTSKVQSYLLCNELLQSYGSTPNDVQGAMIDGVGLFAHEFGHALGLPDFYNVSNSSASVPMGYWDIMDYGQYYQNGYRPIEYNAYERSYMGWLKVKDITNEPAQYLRLAPLASEETDDAVRAYVIRNPESDKEYYLLENKQRNTWLTSTMGSGMFITHVDYNSSAWMSNRVNTSVSHPRFTFVAADNVKEGRTPNGISFSEFFQGYQSDLFPGLKGVTSFTDDTTPAATVYNGTKGLLSRPLFNIEQLEDGIIGFSYLDQSITTGIDGVRHSKSETDANRSLYDLNGRRITSLDKATPGVYILGSKKVVKK